MFVSDVFRSLVVVVLLRWVMISWEIVKWVIVVLVKVILDVVFKLRKEFMNKKLLFVYLIVVEFFCFIKWEWYFVNVVIILNFEFVVLVIFVINCKDDVVVMWLVNISLLLEVLILNIVVVRLKLFLNKFVLLFIMDIKVLV